ncbi:probable SCT1 - suppresses a choline-transport mutant [Cephalotrichum gorgonifer]|uniref:Probable SCT1 - suppresses a choline-transport mutant n=1 Tax=Cephalotrichum gorgonifer TaxID=2041049 RepID=A0AAE8N4K3_9PEZI|nr:probable SCT1 - suppresses a choline-transport mutant [Cephalotrichum gorgonifer]
MERPAAAPEREKSRPSLTKDLYPMVNWKYDVFLWVIGIVIDLFFREVVPRGSWKVPREGPVLFVAAPHANQFVDAIILQRTLRREANRRISLLIAQKSVHGFIGWGSRQVGSVPVGRAQDSAKPATGMIYLPDPVNDPTLIRGVGTRFGEGEGEVGGMLFLPSTKGQSGSSVDIAQILGPEEIRIKRPIKDKTGVRQLTGRDDIDDDGNLLDKDVRGPKEGYQGTKYRLAPHIDQTKVYEAVFARLTSGGCVGIFPEGGSHDRTELLTLKAGVAIMALGSLAEAPDCGLTIVPVGMNYFHPHKFRSRAVVEFGSPFHIPPELVEMYKNNQRRDAIGQLLDTVHQALSSVTVSTPDYDTLMLIQAARRLYNPTGRKLPLPVVVELNRRLALGYEKYKSDQRIIDLREAVKKYNTQLKYLNLRDHQVEYAKMSVIKVFFTLLFRVAKLLVLLIGVLPGLVLFSPVFIATKAISRKKAKEALAGSTVKIHGKDVMATWKVLVAMAFAPTLYHFYSVIVTAKTYQDRFFGIVPDWAPLWVVYVSAFVVMIAITFAALRFGEVGMDIFKSLQPLVLCLVPTSGFNIHTLREQRAQLSKRVTDLINTLGPEMFPDFEKTRLVVNPETRVTDAAAAAVAAREQRRLREAEQHGPEAGSESPPMISRRNSTQPSLGLPRNESFNDIGGVGIFSTRPPSRSGSGSGSDSRRGSGSGSGGSGFGLTGFTSLDSAGGFDEASRRIREAMRERRRKSEAVAVQLGGSEDEDEDDEEEEYNEARKKRV